MHQLVTTSVDENVKDELRLYPNPASNGILVAGLLSESSFDIVNLSGYAVLKGRVKPNQTIDLNQLKSGMYFINIYLQQDAKKVLTLVKQ
jgi:hypothetical protein